MQTRTLLEDKYLIRSQRCVYYKDNQKLIIAYCPILKGKRLKVKRARLISLKNPFEIKVFLTLNDKVKIKEILKKLSSEFKESPERLLVRLEKLIKKYRNIYPDLFRIEKETQAQPKINRKNIRYLKILQTINNELKSTNDLKSNYLNLYDYHFSKIKDADKQFDRIERTLSHTFRQPHPALRRLTYGERIKQELIRRCPFKRKKKNKILEIGAGTGWLARRFLDSLKNKNFSIYKNTKYIFLDLSTTLLKSQKRINRLHLKHTRFLLGNGQYLPLKNNSLDYVIVNEVIADFDIVKLDKENLENLRFKSSTRSRRFKAIKAIFNYNILIDDAPKRFLFGFGIVKLLEELKRVLKPGGLALIIEYGQTWSYPQAVKLKGHREHSVHFGHLKQVATALGFKIEMTDLLDFLKFRKDTKTLDGWSFYLLSRILKKRKQKVPPFISTEKMLKENLREDYQRFGNLRFIKLEQGIGGFHIQGFKVVILYKV
jgi:ubiquinone/menaquinone biosynthesis C-methylase UbiE